MKSRCQSIFVCVGCVIVAASLVLQFWVVPRCAAACEQEQSALTELVARESESMDRAKLAEKNKHLNDQIAAVPTIQDLGSVLEAISSELQDAGARDRQLTTGPESTYQQLAYVTVTLAFKGSQQSIITFLRALSNSSFPVRVSRLEIIRPDGATSHELTTDIVLYVFLRTSETPLQ